VDLTDGCNSQGDSQGLSGFIDLRGPGICTISFQKKSTLITYFVRVRSDRSHPCKKLGTR